MTFALARSLLIADAVAPEALGNALLLSATRGASLVRALLATRAIDLPRLEQHLERGEAPSMRHIAPVGSLLQSLPPGLCERLLALPVRRDPRTGTVDVAVVDARDPHAADEISYWLKAPVRVVRTSLTSMEVALGRIDSMLDLAMRPLAAPMGAAVLTEPGGPSEPIQEMGAGPNIPIALTRRSLPPPGVSVIVGPPAIERDGPRGGPREREPVLDLRRRKVSGPASDAFVREAPPTQRGPFASSPPTASWEPTSAIVEKMHEAQDRDRILELLISGVGAVARNALILAVRRDVIAGWTGSPGIRDRTALRDLRMPVSSRTAMSEGLDHEGIRLVRLPDDAVHGPLATLLGIAPTSAVAVGAVRVEGKPVALVVAADLIDNIRAMSHMADLTPAAGEALARLLRERRK
ncbi:MAG: hypothetical protein ACLP1X_00790 [Polyangiaceae bacterium]